MKIGSITATTWGSYAIVGRFDGDGINFALHYGMHQRASR